MRKIDLSTVKDCDRIWECGEYVVATGKFLWVFRKDGSFVAKSKTIRRPGKLYFLPPDKVFVVGGADYQYHYINLLTAEDIWTTSYDRKGVLRSRRFVASSDNCYLYDMYCHNVRNQWYVLRFSLENFMVSKVEVPESLRTTIDIYTDEEGVLYALQTHLLGDDGKISQNGILRIDWRGEKPIFSWECMWKSEHNRWKEWNHTDGHFILCEDYTVIDMLTMQSFNLLENDSNWIPAFGSHNCVYFPERELLIAYHGMEDGNVVIDCKARKRIAQYASSSIQAGYAGYLIGDEYWIGTEEGIIRKPFPIFEEIPEKGFPGWMSAKSMRMKRREQLNQIAK